MKAIKALSFFVAICLVFLISIVSAQRLFWKCCHTDQPTYCSVQGSSCTTTLCQDPDACAHQTCYLANVEEPDCPGGESFSLIQWQSESPVQVVALNQTYLHYMRGLMVLNTSNSPVIQVRIGWILYGKRTANSPREIIRKETGNSNDVYLQPKKIGLLGMQKWLRTDTAQWIKAHPEFNIFETVVGVVYARTESGIAFQLELEKINKFEEEKNGSIQSIYSGSFTNDALESFRNLNP